MYQTGYYWVLFEGHRELEVFIYDGESWKDFEGSFCNTEYFEVIRFIQEPKKDGKE